ncbi:MAG TPA: alpha/beta hydrolase family protein [Bryobacteraceae bacterium]|nr:alpha/beta hydrolase family protein [Bryobacteraceae bacterium]HOQ46172.1 alpha/beta hydrolase family protein [Bryobacteraceae bacterium]HPQ14916.1 alpha/beta hydrolase family protein [Bryobacteraceae bacterium]HPU72687.1 alpha/beta hydrolase family protein [Bryobacteraceae bacterium]
MRLLVLLLTAVLCAPAADVRTGVAARNISTVKFQSESLGQERAFNILLPLDYETSTSRYPVLYLLHGLGDDHTAWSFMTNLSGYAAEHKIIVVMPDASRSWYVNSAANPKERFEDYIIKDLVPYIDSHYRTIPLRRARAVAGLSMGGYGATFLGLKHYRLFSAIGAFSAAVGIAHDRPDSPALGNRLQREIQPRFGSTPEERSARDPFALVEKVPPAEMPLLYIACGGQDFLLKQNRDFIQLLAEKKIPYEYREISPRAHTWDFWDEQIRVFLEIFEKASR